MQTRNHRIAAAVLFMAAILLSGNYTGRPGHHEERRRHHRRYQQDRRRQGLHRTRYADEFSVKLAEVVSIDADETFEIELEDGSNVDASFAHGADGMQTLIVDGQPRDIPMEELTMATEPEPWYERTSHVDVNMTWNSGNTDSRNNLIYADTSLRTG